MFFLDNKVDNDYYRRERQHTRMLPSMYMDPWAVIKKALHKYSGETRSCPVPFPTAACPEFHVGYSLG